MKIKKLEEWSPQELLMFGIIFGLIGFALGRFLEAKGLVIQLLLILIMFTGLIFFVVGIGKSLLKLEQRGKIKILREEPPRSLKKFIFVIIIPVIISLSIFYWFEMRPRRIALKCFKEALRESPTSEIDFFSTSSENSEKNIMEEKYLECLKRHNYNLEK